MAIEFFNQDDFENALRAGNVEFKSLGFVGQELTYEIPIDARTSIELRSTIWRDGVSATTGDDSIRMWLRTTDGKPLGKLDKWTQRTAGWQTRMLEKIESLKEYRALAGDCPSCGKPLACWITSQGKNEGRIYAKCMHENKWVKFINAKKDSAPFQSQTKVAKELAKPAQKVSALDALNQDAQNDAPPAPVFVKKEFKPSAYNLAIRDFILNKTENLRVDGVAGCGKTTNNVFVAESMPKHLRIASMVYNKRNQLDMEKKLPKHVVSATSHSAAFRDIMRATKGVKIDDKNRKMWDLFNGYIHELNDSQHEATAETLQLAGSDIIKLTGLIKNTLGDMSDANLESLCEHYGVMLNGAQDDAYKCVRELMKRSDEQGATLIDFDDMVNYPARGDVAGRKYSVTPWDFLFIDEQQDTNNAQQQYYLKAGSRIMFVGDVGQAIYGFRGADVDAMDNMQRALNAERLPLSVCYRCASSIIELAKQIVPQIEAAPNARDGLVRTINEGELLQNVNPGDMVLCRLNAPLVRPAFELIRNRKKAVILGKEIGVGLITLLTKVQRKHGIDGAELLLVLSKLAEYGALEALRLRASRKENQATMLEDQIETLIALSDGCDTVQDVKDNTNLVFSDTAIGTVFSSVHKAKGNEAENVFILRPDLMPHPKAKEPWARVQEQNIKYVAITRAMNTLTWVNPD